MGGGGRGGSDAVDVAFVPFQGHHALGESDLTLQRRQCVVVMWVGAALWWLLVQSTVARTREWQRLDRRIVCVWGGGDTCGKVLLCLYIYIYIIYSTFTFF